MAGLLVLLMGGAAMVAVVWEWALDNECRRVGDIWRVTLYPVKKWWKSLGDA